MSAVESAGARRRRSGIAAALLGALTLIGAFGASRSSVIWAAMPGRIGAPATTITIDSPDRDGAPLVRLAVLGDVGTGDAAERETAQLVTTAAATDPFDALILLGDNVYPDGDPTRLDATVFQPFERILQQGTAVLPVLGNHDVQDGHAAGQVEMLGMPGRWYATQVGRALIVAVDSNVVDDPGQQQWLDTTLATTTADWVIVTMHHPAYSAGYHGSSEAVRDTWVPLFERYDVDLVLAGHDHDYQRTHPISGTTYIVSGGGAKTRPTDRADFTAYAASVLHYLDIGVWDDHLDVTAYSTAGPFDHVTLHPADVTTTVSSSSQSAPVENSQTALIVASVVGAVGVALWVLALLVGWYGPPEVTLRYQRTVLGGTTIGMAATFTGIATAAALTLL